MVPETRDGSWGRWPGHGPPPRPTQHWPCHLHVPIKNRRALDLLTAERGGTCIFLQEECCYYINESGLVETRIESLQKLKTNLQSQKFSAEATAWWSSSMYTLLSPLLGPLVAVCLILLIAPCFLQFLQRRFQELTRVTIYQMLLQPYPERVQEIDLSPTIQAP
uniref:endogenous retrovirus group FC1 Env polyprotein-like n=2 Tax=Callithrix jacchus TaxID=9483 RepID=UPI0023DD4377|nr:endogenous retrovirus group FC1 Env polyprotein-like [Callithrix jacchus]